MKGMNMLKKLDQEERHREANLDKWQANLGKFEYDFRRPSNLKIEKLKPTSYVFATINKDRKESKNLLKKIEFNRNNSILKDSYEKLLEITNASG